MLVLQAFGVACPARATASCADGRANTPACLRNGCMDTLGENYAAAAEFEPEDACVYNWLDCAAPPPERATPGSCNATVPHDSLCAFECSDGTDMQLVCPVTIRVETGRYAEEYSWRVDGEPAVYVPDGGYQVVPARCVALCTAACYYQILCYRSSSLYHICSESRYLYACHDNATEPYCGISVPKPKTWPDPAICT